MKRACSFFLVLILLLISVPTIASASTLPAEILGEWSSYGTLFGSTEELNLHLALGDLESFAATRSAEVYSGSTGFYIYENGTVDFLINKEVIGSGTWTWDEESPLITLDDGSGTGVKSLLEGISELSLSYSDGLLSGGYKSSDYTTLLFYYRPSLLSINPAAYAETGWKLRNILNEEGSTEASTAKLDYQFTLHADGTASMLINYAPVTGTWSVDGYNLIINHPNGPVLKLEPQLDGTIFGSHTPVNGSITMMEFGQREAFSFIADPVPLDELLGTWKLTGAYGVAMGGEVKLPYSPEALAAIDYTISLNAGESTMVYTSSKSNTVNDFTASVVGGPVLDADEDTGTILIFKFSTGGKKPFWLKKDGSLHSMNPGDVTEFVFGKVE